MSEVLLAEYGRAKTLSFELYEVDGVDLRVDAADAGADCTVRGDEGASGTCTNDFVDEGDTYSLVLTAAEMAFARITTKIVDSATKVWLDKVIIIETYGHPSSGHPWLSPFWTNGAVNDGSASSTVWTFDGFTEATADHVIGSELTFTSGANAGQTRTVTDYTSTVITVSPAFLAAPADNDEFVLKTAPQTSLGNVPGVDLASVLADTAVIGAAGVGLTEAGGDGDHLTEAGATGNHLSAVPWNAAWDAEVQSEVDDALKALHLDHLVIAQGTVETSGSNSSTQVQTTLGEATNNHYNHGTILFLDNAEAGQYRPILDYVGATGVISWDRALTSTPGDGTEFILLPVGVDAAGVWDEILTGATHNIAASGGRRLRGIQEFQGYEGGAIWIDTQDGTAGTTDFENGTVENPVDSIADALTLSASLNLKKFKVAPGSTIALGATFTTKEMEGFEWTLDLDGRDIGGSEFVGASVSGIGTGTGTTEFLDCFMGATTIPAGTHLINCDYEGTITLGAAGTFYMENCTHGSAAAAILDFGSGLNASTVHMHPFHGGLEIQNMGAGTGTYVLHIDGNGSITFNANCSATSTINLSGNWALTNNASGLTINDDGHVSQTTVNAQVDGAWITQVADSVASDGSRPTREQALYLAIQFLSEFAINGTTYTVKKPDGSTTLATFTLDDGTTPTSITRS